MSHQRYPSIDPVKEPHSVSLKVLRLSRPALVTQNPLPTPESTPPSGPIPGSLAYHTTADTNPDPFLLTPILNLPPSFGSAYVGETFSCTLCANHDIISPDPISLSATTPHSPGGPPRPGAPAAPSKKKFIRDVRVEAEMKTPGSAAPQKLVLGPAPAPAPASTEAADPAPQQQNQNKPPTGDRDPASSPPDDDPLGSPATTTTTTTTPITLRPGASVAAPAGAADLDPGQTLQRIVNFELKEEGNHVLAVTVSYYEATETSGRTRTFRKLYQFICKGSLIVRTKVGALPSSPATATPGQEGEGEERGPHDEDEEEAEEEVEEEETEGGAGEGGGGAVAAAVAEARARRREEKKKKNENKNKKQAQGRRRWVMEAQLENCSEEIMQLERVGLELERGLRYTDCNWEVGVARRAAGARAGGGGGGGGGGPVGGRGRVLKKPVLHPGEVEQCCFIVEETADGDGGGAAEDVEGRVMFGVLAIGWRTEMGNKGHLCTGRLGARTR